MVKECNTHGREDECIYDFERRLEGKRQLRRTGCRWENNF
jgi:hypothetical protein